VADPGRIGPVSVWPVEPASERSRRWAWAGPWRWAWVGGGLALVAACSAVWSPLRLPDAATDKTAGDRLVPAPASVPQSIAAATAAAPDAVAGIPFVRALDGDAEGRLLSAYAALGEGRGREAFEMAAALVNDHPNFALAQLLYADLLATRAGWPAAFGAEAQALTDSQDARRRGLRLEAQRRIAAFTERPPAGQVPAEFVRLAPSIKYAIAVDATRSRLYLFANGPQGLTLERDFYVSLGKQGVGKHTEGDRRTPLGVYWISAALPKHQLDARFGNGALRFNYPNASDKMQGRTGSGLFLHGVPAEVLNHEPWATDGCVAMSNADIELLLRTLDVSATPVVITQGLQWVPPEALRQAAASFDTAWHAWSQARREPASDAAAGWYMPGAPELPRWKPEVAEQQHLSLLSWQGESDGRPLMIVTSHAQAGGSAGHSVTYRQYWTRHDKDWRIAFEGSVAPATDATGGRSSSGVAASSDGSGAGDAVAKAATAPRNPARPVRKP
jgi:L,D-transpeptidase YnhG